MKKFIIILISPLLMVSTYGIGQNSNSKSVPEFFKFIFEVPEYVYGNVKEIHCESFEANEQNGKIVHTARLLINNWNLQTCTYFLNPQGQIIQMNASNMAGEYIGIFNYQDSKIGNINWLKNDTLKYNWDYTYPNKDKIMRTSFDVQNNRSEGSIYYEFDNNGLIMNRIQRGANGEQVGNSIIYKRNDEGKILDKMAVSPQGKTVNHFDIYDYDENARIQRGHRNIINGEKVDFYGATHTYEYDDKGNWIKRTSVFPNNNIRVTVRTFVFY